MNLKGYDILKATVDYGGLILSFLSVIVSPVYSYFRHTVAETPKIMWKALKKSSGRWQWYKKSFQYLLFFSGLSYLLFHSASFVLSLTSACLVVTAILAILLSIAIPTIEEGMTMNDIKYERKQVISRKAKEKDLEESLYQISEFAACLEHPNRYWHTDSASIGFRVPIYLLQFQILSMKH
ncbi:hypothetical protein Q7M63_00385 [Candidatus Liberibacter asiaticus]